MSRFRRAARRRSLGCRAWHRCRMVERRAARALAAAAGERTPPYGHGRTVDVLQPMASARPPHPDAPPPGADELRRAVGGHPSWIV